MSVNETKMNTEHMYEEAQIQEVVDFGEYDDYGEYAYYEELDEYDEYDKYSEYEEEYGEEPTFEKTNRQGGVRKVRF